MNLPVLGCFLYISPTYGHIRVPAGMGHKLKDPLLSIVSNVVGYVYAESGLHKLIGSAVLSVEFYMKCC